MTWTCPNCDRDYPDSGIGLPLGKDADEMTHCNVCDVNPADLRELVEDYRRGLEGDNPSFLAKIEAVLESYE